MFVAGAQRSGTNMVMDLLDRSLDTTVYHERDPRAFDNYLMREPEVIDRLVEHARGRVFVIKALCEMDRLPALMARYQPARTLWVYRHYAGAVRSSLRSFSTVAGQVARLIEDPDSAGWMGRGIGPETLAQVRCLYRPSLNDASHVALFWYMRNRLLFDQGLAGDGRVMMLRYEELLAEPVERLGSLFEDLGLPFNESITADIDRRASANPGDPGIDADVRAACDALLIELDALAARGARAA